MGNLQEKNRYTEKLEQEIIILNNQKNAIIEKTTKYINEEKRKFIIKNIFLLQFYTE